MYGQQSLIKKEERKKKKSLITKVSNLQAQIYQEIDYVVSTLIINKYIYT